MNCSTLALALPFYRQIPFFLSAARPTKYSSHVESSHLVGNCFKDISVTVDFKDSPFTANI